MKRVLSAILACVAAMQVMAADVFVNFRQGDWQLNADGRITIYVAADEQQGVMLAAQNLKTDLERVCGAAVTFVAQPAEARIVAGTAARLKMYQRELRGKVEQYMLDARQG